MPNTSADIKSIPALVVFCPLDQHGEVTGAPLQVIGSRLETRTSHDDPDNVWSRAIVIVWTQTLIATRSPLWRLEGATSSGRPSTRTRNQFDWQTREIAQASIPLRVVGRSCGKFYPDLQRSKSNLLPTSQKVSQKSSLKIPTKHATKNQCWRRISPNFGSYRGQRHHRRQSRTQPSKV